MDGVDQRLAVLEEEKRQAKAIVKSQCGNKGSASVLRWALKMQFEENAAKNQRIVELENELECALIKASTPCNEQPSYLSIEEITRMMPVLLSDLKHESDIDGRACTNNNIRRALRAYTVRNLFSDERFKHTERVSGTKQEGLFIKGYVRDVWEYLDQANKLIDDTDFEQVFDTQIKIEMSERNKKAVNSTPARRSTM